MLESRPRTYSPHWDGYAFNRKHLGDEAWLWGLAGNSAQPEFDTTVCFHCFCFYDIGFLFTVVIKVSKSQCILCKKKWFCLNKNMKEVILIWCGCGKSSISDMRMPTPPVKAEMQGHLLVPRAKGIIDGPSGHSEGEVLSASVCVCVCVCVCPYGPRWQSWELECTDCGKWGDFSGMFP